MKQLLFSLVFCTIASSLQAQNIQRDIPYAEDGHPRHTLDIYAPSSTKNLPVVFWIHGGGWEKGDKTDVNLKPQWFMDRGFVFVSTTYRLLPEVDMGALTRDVAKAFGWMEKHIVDYGGDPARVLVGGHSAGAQLAALLCTDDRYVKAEGAAFTCLIGCVPVDGDTYDVLAIIETAETRRRVHGQEQPKNGHREKFGNDPAKHKDFSAVTHVAKGKNIPPFLILHVAAQPDNSAQAFRLSTLLKAADVPVTVFGAKSTDHSKLNNDLGLPEDPATKALDAFVAGVLKK